MKTLNLKHNTLFYDILHNRVKIKDLKNLGQTRSGKMPMWEIKLPDQGDTRITCVYYSYEDYLHDIKELGLVKEIFTSENFDSLQKTCDKINLLCKENVDGDLMYSQKIFSKDLILEFVKNPIVSNSGII